MRHWDILTANIGIHRTIGMTKYITAPSVRNTTFQYQDRKTASRISEASVT